VVEHLDLEQLTGADEVAGNLDVGLGRRRVAAGVIVLCGARSYVQQQGRRIV